MSDGNFQETNDYVVSDELKQIVNVALSLKKPLLIRGEPGTGKTLLASAAAQSLNMPLIRWHVKSTSKAQDGLYVYDTIQRLNDSRFGGGKVDDIAHYIKLGALGQAFKSDTRSVVLIDEIDKADIEFPNDLLHELDAMEFDIPETGERIKAKERPFILITSNAEKELPDAFLRRCLFHYIEFPDSNLMTEIIKVHYPDIKQKLLDRCLEKFYAIRELPDIHKKPSTSELLDWIAAIRKSGISDGELKNSLPFLGVLLKKEQDLSSIRKPSYGKKGFF